MIRTSALETVFGITPIQTDIENLEAGLEDYLERLESLGGINILFPGLGSEAGEASHLAYNKPGSGATVRDLAGLIPISTDILRNHAYPC